VCLTFDDGPNGKATSQVLDVLQRYQVQATFFLIGRNVERDPALAARIVREGHLVGNHSYGQKRLLAFRSFDCIQHDLAKTTELIVQATGTRPRYFRPPYGLMTARMQQVCVELGLFPLGVHVFVNDSFITDPTRIARSVLRSIQGGAYIVVLHDGFGTVDAPSRIVVAKALEYIIPELNRQGYRWVNPKHMTDKAHLKSGNPEMAH